MKNARKQLLRLLVICICILILTSGQVVAAYGYDCSISVLHITRSRGQVNEFYGSAYADTEVWGIPWPGGLSYIKCIPRSMYNQPLIIYRQSLPSKNFQATSDPKTGKSMWVYDSGTRMVIGRQDYRLNSRATANTLDHREATTYLKDWRIFDQAAILIRVVN